MTVNPIRFRPAAQGGWLAIVADSHLLVLGEQPEASFIDEAWRAVTAASAFQSLLDLLTRNGLAATPPFALVERGEVTTRVIVRGEVTLRLTTADGEQVLSGAGVSTWIERALTQVGSLSLEVSGAVPAASVDTLPLTAGAAWIAGLSLGGQPPIPATAMPQALASTEIAAPSVAPAVAVPTPGPDDEIDIGATVADLPTMAEVPRPATEGDGYDYLFGATIMRPVADAAVHVEEPPELDEPMSSTSPSADREAVEETGDHDGETILTSDIAALRGAARRRTVAPSASPPVVAGVSLVLPNGAREPLDRKVLVGRSPSVSKVSGGDLPRLITLEDPEQDISRNHAQVALEGDTVVVTDLHSRNGTLIVLPGKSPQKLRAGEPTAVIVGTVIDFGGGITLTVEQD